MPWPTASARTKNWGSEILTDADLEAQFDLLHNYINAFLAGASGHDHTGSDGYGKNIPLASAVSGILPVANGGTNKASYTQGDILFASATTTISVLAAGTKGQALTTGGAAANPTFEGMTTTGDIEYHNGTNRTRLAKGSNGQICQLVSGFPAWVSLFGTPISKSNNTDYLADTDGFFIGLIDTSASNGTYGDITGYTDAASSPTTVMGYASGWRVDSTFFGSSGNRKNSFCIPVKRGNYYRGTLTTGGGSPTATYYFVPIGS